MDHLAQDLTVALEESESCGTINIINGSKWGMRRRTRSAGNLRKPFIYNPIVSVSKYNFSELFFNKQGDEHHSDGSSSSNSELRPDKHRNKLVSFHQSDSDDMSISIAVAKALNSKASLRMKHPLNSFFRGEYVLLSHLSNIYIMSFRVDPILAANELTIGGILQSSSDQILVLFFVIFTIFCSKFIFHSSVHILNKIK